MSAAKDAARLLMAAELDLQRCGESLFRITRERDSLRAEAERIRATKPDPETPLVLRGAAARQMTAFETWQDLTLREIGMKLAELAAARDAQLVATRRALGRLEALRLLARSSRRR